VPPRLAYALCDALGDIAYRALPRQRRAVRSNLARVLGERSRNLDRRVQQVFRSGAKYYYDTFKVASLTDAELMRLAPVSGWDNLDRALEAGKGALLATAHLGSPGLVSHSLSVRGYSVTVPAEPVRPKRLFDLMCRVRGSRGNRLIPVGPGTTRELTDALRRNEVVGILVDRDVQKTGVTVDLFGAPVPLPAGPVTLALRTGAALVPAFTFRTRDGRLEGRIGEPVEIERTGSLREDVRRNTQKVAALLEEAVRRCPEQWVVFEPMWPAEEAASRLEGSL
jgi:phosphatidylinositol dimannoside acyltransferase